LRSDRKSCVQSYYRGQKSEVVHLLEIAPALRLRWAERKRARSENLGCTTGPSRVFRGIKCVENSFFAAKISAIEFAADKHYPVPAAASLVHFEF
jgi:hypothetical protein